MDETGHFWVRITDKESMKLPAKGRSIEKEWTKPIASKVKATDKKSIKLPALKKNGRNQPC